MQAYSEFCSHHSEANSFYKEQMQNNKKLQILIKVRNPHALVNVDVSRPAVVCCCIESAGVY